MIGGKRSQRRRDNLRMKHRAQHIYGNDGILYERPNGVEEPEKWADHLKMCSCIMCGNPRRQFGQRTMQERRADVC